MELQIDTRGNRVCVTGTWVSGTRRWEATALAALVEAVTTSGSSEVTSHDLGHRLMEQGQLTPLTRAAHRRLWMSLEEMFNKARAGDGFRARFRYPPRKLTVGPWSWAALPGDRTEVADRGDVEDGAARVELHSVSKGNDLTATLALVRKLALVHSSWLHGSRLAAISELSMGPEWELAAPPILVHRALTLADAHAMVEQYPQARQHLRDALHLIEAHPTCRDQRTFAEFMRMALSGTADRGLVPSGHQVIAITQLLADPAVRQSEVDYRSRTWAYLHAAFGRRNMAADHSCDPEASSLARAEIVQLLSAALCMSIVGWQTDLVPVATEGHLRELAPIGRVAAPLSLDHCLDLYHTAQYWRQMLDVPRSFEVGHLWMAMLAAEHRDVGRMARSRCDQGQWIGPVPDSIDFFREIHARTLATDDPKSIVRSALALYRYAKRVGDVATERKAAAEFVSLAQKWRTTRTLLKVIAAEVAAPELMRMVDGIGPEDDEPDPGPGHITQSAH